MFTLTSPTDERSLIVRNLKTLLENCILQNFATLSKGELVLLHDYGSWLSWFDRLYWFILLVLKTINTNSHGWSFGEGFVWQSGFVMCNIYGSIWLLSIASWMPTEDPTFVIPSSVKLSPAQLEILSAYNVQPGMAFSLTNEGTIVPPNAKKFKLKMVKSFVSIRADSVILTEVTRGMFSVGFTYSSTMVVSCTISFNVRDHTTSSKLE